jgi:hypothetical protein
MIPLQNMKKLFLILSLFGILMLPAFAFADTGHGAGEPHGNGITQSGSIHLHDDGSVHSHEVEGFELATPWSSRWWMLMGISLILTGLLSMWVQKYLQVV